jgi:hypothetical protein
MKPTVQHSENIGGLSRSERSARRNTGLPKTDFAYHSASVAHLNGRCFGSHGRSFRAISDDYFKTEAPQTFVGEAALFVVIVLTAALPLLNGATVLLHFVRSLGAI